MGKRMICALAVIMLLLARVPVDAAAVKSPYMAEQAHGKAPNVTVYMTGSKMKETSSVSGKIKDITLEQKGDIVPFDQSKKRISYIILMDNSGSVDQAQFDESKAQLVQMRQSLRKGDKMTLYTVGTDDPEGEKTKVFSSRVKDTDAKLAKDCEKIGAVPYMNTKESMTVLYRSLNEILHEQASPKERTVVLLITDGEDDSKGKDIDNVSTANTVKEASVPVYGILLANKSGEEDEKMSYTKNQILAEKNCRGYYADCSVQPSPESVQAAFAQIQQLLQKDSYVVDLSAATNRAVGREELELEVDRSAIDPVTIDYSDHEEDTEAPRIVGSVEKISKNAVRFSLQDANGVNVQDAKDISHYIIQTDLEDGKGKSWPIDSVSVEERGLEIVVTLTMKDEFFIGDHILKCSGIRDASQDANIMETSLRFSVKDGLDPKKVAAAKAVRDHWWVALVLLVLLLGLLIIRAIRKKKTEVVEVDPDELVKADTKKIWLTITDRSGAIKDVEWDVEGSLFVGRSNICNIYFDDDRLSKQHFVIEVTKMGCYLEDLQSTNGTFVNGVKITNRRMLLDGDIITAGRETIVFHVPRSQAAMDIEG